MRSSNSNSFLNLKSSANIFALGTTGILFFFADFNSMLVFFMADEITTISAPRTLRFGMFSINFYTYFF